MGSGIAQVAAEHGYPVIMRDVEQALVDRGLGLMRERWMRGVERGKMTAAAMSEAEGNVRGVVALDALGECDLIVEAITENLEEKRKLFSALDRLCPSGTVLATNTSALSVTELAMATGRADRVCGLHFFNPVPAMKLVEVVRTLLTSPGVFDAALEFVRSVGKEPVAAADRAGFIVNRLLVPYLLDAIRAVEAGVASVGDTDTAMRLGCGYPMGPFALLDLIGLDTICAIADIMFLEFRETRYAPPPLLRGMVRAGRYGKKSGRGFYDYGGAQPGAA
jgi:3-hydroxybutyryl-CoA dehydrogenase